jgi:hypothetical protein
MPVALRAKQAPTRAYAESAKDGEDAQHHDISGVEGPLERHQLARRKHEHGKCREPDAQQYPGDCPLAPISVMNHIGL